MSLQAMVWAVEDAPDVPAQCLAVLQGLANHADREGRNAYPSVELLAHYTRKAERSVQNDLRTLEKLGLIRRGDQRAAYDIPERYRPTVWDLAMERRRAPYVPKRWRDAPVAHPDDPGPLAPDDDSADADTPSDGHSPQPAPDGVRGAAGCTPGYPQGCSPLPAGVQPTAPEPPPNQRVVTTGGVSAVGRGSTAPPPRTPTDPAPATPGPGGVPPEPPLRCPAHRTTPASGPCPPCGDARRAHQVWEGERLAERQAADAAARARARQARADADAERDACRLCDREGTAWVNDRSIACLHGEAANVAAAAKAPRAGRPWREWAAEAAS